MFAFFCFVAVVSVCEADAKVKDNPTITASRRRLHALLCLHHDGHNRPGKNVAFATLVGDRLAQSNQQPYLARTTTISLHGIYTAS